MGGNRYEMWHAICITIEVLIGLVIGISGLLRPFDPKFFDGIAVSLTGPFVIFSVVHFVVAGLFILGVIPDPDVIGVSHDEDAEQHQPPKSTTEATNGQSEPRELKIERQD